MSRYLIISSDGHAGPPTQVYRPYLESKFHRDFDAQQTQVSTIDQFERSPAKGLILKAHMHRWRDPQTEHLRERSKGAWDIKKRMQEMDAEGIAAEVLFPDGQFGNDFPFGGFFGYDLPERRVAGAKAHNRWLAEFCASEPRRLCGLAFIIPFDVVDAVAEVQRAHAEGLRGILLPTAEVALPLYHEQRYEPLWAVCAELGLPVHMHGGQTPNIYGTPGPAALAIGELESNFFRRRMLGHMLLGGVFARHPALRFVCTEVGMDWIPAELDRLERVYRQESMTVGFAPQAWLPLSPREYWRRNCAVGATFVSREELAIWPKLGSETIMWGADYPHVETTWPNSWVDIQGTFARVPDLEVRQMLGLNALNIYGFDRAALETIVQRIGPESRSFPDFTSTASSAFTDEDYAESRVFGHATFARRLTRSLEQ